MTSFGTFISLPGLAVLMARAMHTFSQGFRSVTVILLFLLHRTEASQSLHSLLRTMKGERREHNTVGGGAINEKKRLFEKSIENSEDQPFGSSYDPARFRSHLWQALEGMDRYPNYLSRWNTDDMDKLEEALELQLSKVREQRQAIASRRRGIEMVVDRLVEQDEKWLPFLQPPESWDDVLEVLDPQIAKAVFESRQFKKGAVPSLKTVLSGECDVEIDVHLLETIMDQETFDVYSLPLLSKEVSRNRCPQFPIFPIKQDFSSLGNSFVGNCLK